MSIYNKAARHKTKTSKRRNEKQRARCSQQHRRVNIFLSRQHSSTRTGPVRLRLLLLHLLDKLVSIHCIISSHFLCTSAILICSHVALPHSLRACYICLVCASWLRAANVSDAKVYIRALLALLQFWTQLVSKSLPFYPDISLHKLKLFYMCPKSIYYTKAQDKRKFKKLAKLYG